VRLGRAAAELVEDGETVFVDCSSTAFYAVRALIELETPATVLTPSVAVMDLIAHADSSQLDLLGLAGSLRRLTRSFVGPQTVHAIESHFADKLLFSVKGIAPGNVMTDANPLEAEVKRAMIDRAPRPGAADRRLQVRPAGAERDRPGLRRLAGTGRGRRARGPARAGRHRRDGAGGVMALVELEHATKSYGAVRALRDGTLSLRPGEVRALVGENGAGKSTLVKLLAGVIRLDSGRLAVDGAPADFHSPTAARDAGIAVIYQEPTLFPDLSVAENVVMGRHPLGGGRRIDRQAMQEQVRGLLDRLGVRMDPERPVRGLSIADQQIVEIAKALSFDARVLIMDEPTAALAGPEVERLFGVIRALKERGAAVLFISHRLEEVFAVCDTVTVMRDGAVVHSAATDDIDADELVRRMVGRDLDTLFPKLEAEIRGLALKVERLTREGVFTDVSFEVRAGEIVAPAGLVGAGRSFLREAKAQARQVRPSLAAAALREYVRPLSCGPGHRLCA
jgi:ABC-type branched-subunit amino acid transport system ATPase component